MPWCLCLVCCETKEDGAAGGVAQPTEGWSAKALDAGRNWLRFEVYGYLMMVASAQ